VRVVSLEDTVGLKARARHDRFVIRDSWYDDLALRLVADLTDDEVPDDL
jgi:hypothetical protein